MLAETVDAIWKMVEQAAADDALDPSRGGPGALLARRELVARGTRRLSAVIRRGVESGAGTPPPAGVAGVYHEPPLIGRLEPAGGLSHRAVV